MTRRDGTTKRDHGRRRRVGALQLMFSLVVCLDFTACGTCVGPPPPSAGPGPGTADFLDTKDFLGEFTPNPQSTTLGGKAIYAGRISFANLPRTLVEQVLPSSLAGLELAANTSATPNVHPVVLILGHQTQTAWVLPGGFEPPIGADYSELILVIPFVQQKLSQKWHNYVVRIYLDDIWGIAIGNYFFGLEKLDAGFAETSTSFEVSATGGAQLFALTASDFGNWIPSSTAESTLPNYADFLKIFEMPILGTQQWQSPPKRVCSYFEWKFDQAEVRKITTTHKFIEAFASGMTGWVGTEFSSLDSGAFEIRGLQWLMRMPAVECDF